MNFAKPEKIPLKQAWKREDKDFTPWLAENLHYLNDLGLGEISLIDIEVKVPGVGRRLDILAETNSEKRIAIENQYNTADHDHLTRGLSYAVGLDASALVVIAESHSSEFRAVAEYLNRSAEALGDDGIPIFLVSISVEKLENYLIPRFEILEEPNTWLAEVAASEAGRSLSKADKLRGDSYRAFWETYLPLVRGRSDDEMFVASKPNPHNGVFMPAGISGSSLYFGQSVKKQTTNPGVWIDEGDAGINDEIYNYLKDKAEEIEKNLGFELRWTANPRHRGRGISGRDTLECGWNTPVDTRNENIEKSIDDMIQFRKVMTPFLKEAFEDAIS